MTIRHDNLPAAEIAGALNDALSRNGSVVVTAPPGAGKSTLLPLTIGDNLYRSAGSKGKILMLEPRRLAARQIAERMSSMIGEHVGQTVGYRVRFESKISAQTKIEVLTEGIMTRMLVDDPTQEGVDVVIFDEFHERSLDSDVALALTREAQQVLRPDLKIVIMSATIDTDAICKALGAPLVESRGRMFPVEIANCLNEQAEESNAAELAAHYVRKAHAERDGDILVFLPGEAEIRKCQGLLGEALSPTEIYPLYGMLPPEEQRKAIAPSRPGSRKVVLATPIAETSITIEGVRIVIDTGLYRKTEFNSQSGLSRLVTARVSADMATQRSGRAGRVAPGVCYRLWTKATDARMEPCRKPEILEADLASTALSIAAWGGTMDQLPWLTPPPTYKIRQAERLLSLLGAIDDSGRITDHGRQLAKLPCHPRIAQMFSVAKSASEKALAADLAALLEEKDPLPQAGANISLRLDAIRSGRGHSRLERAAEQYRRLSGVRKDEETADAFAAGALIAAAYPERVAKACGGAHYILACGDQGFADDSDPLTAHEWLAIANIGVRAGSAGRIFLAAPVNPADLRSLIRERDVLAWDARKGAITAQRESRIGNLLISSSPLPNPSREKIDAAICEAASVSMFDFNDDVENLQRRVAAVASWHPELELPDMSTESVLSKASEWLPPFIGKATTAAELRKINLCEALWALLSYDQQQAVERLAPARLTVPTGSSIRLEYRVGAEYPVLRVRLQECFGMTDTPRVDGGRIPVLMELLSPGYKPVQLTQDLKSFWGSTYFEVRKDLRRRYPKHSWPDNPLEAPAVRGVKKPQSK